MLKGTPQLRKHPVYCYKLFCQFLPNLIYSLPEPQQKHLKKVLNDCLTKNETLNT
jgi:hypothetical protein